MAFLTETRKFVAWVFRFYLNWYNYIHNTKSKATSQLALDFMAAPCNTEVAKCIFNMEEMGTLLLVSLQIIAPRFPANQNIYLVENENFGNNRKPQGLWCTLRLEFILMGSTQD